MAAAGFNGSKMVEIIALTAQCILISDCFELPNPWDVGYARSPAGAGSRLPLPPVRLHSSIHARCTGRTMFEATMHPVVLLRKTKDLSLEERVHRASIRRVVA
jgi:hypothetical protein